MTEMPTDLPNRRPGAEWSSFAGLTVPMCVSIKRTPHGTATAMMNRPDEVSSALSDVRWLGGGSSSILSTIGCSGGRGRIPGWEREEAISPA